LDKSSLKHILKFISMTEIALALFFLLPIFVGVIYHEEVRVFVLFDVSCLLVSSAVFFFLRNHKVDLNVKEGILAVNLVWILLGFMGAYPLFMYTDVSISSALFESISGFTTTGATVYSDIESLPKMILTLRSLMHWLGGMGIIVLGVGLFSILNPNGSVALFKAESTGLTAEKITPRIKDTALRLWAVYALLTLIDLLLLYFEGMTFFDALNHAFSTISTGGFSTKNNSLAYYADNSLIIWTTTLFMLLSGVNFIAHLKLFNKDFSGYKTETFFWYIRIFIFLSLSLSLMHYFSSQNSLYFSLTHGFFTISSILTTTGFATLDYEQWGHFAISLAFVAMLIGGNTSSTAGGVKVIRYIIIFKTLAAEIKKILYPNAIFNVFINDNKMKDNVIYSTVGFFMLFSMANLILTLYLFSRGYDAMTSVSASLACIGNIGPGFGAVGPVNNYSFFNDFDKIILSVFMIIGRLEFYTVVLLFTKRFWQRF